MKIKNKNLNKNLSPNDASGIHPMQNAKRPAMEDWQHWRR